MTSHWMDQPRDKFGRWTDDGSDGMPSRSEITQMIIRRMGGKDPVLPKYKDRIVQVANQAGDAPGDVATNTPTHAGSPKREVLPHDHSIKVHPPLKGELLIRNPDNHGEGHFGANRTKVEDSGKEVNYGHPGVDLYAPPGTPVYATTDGVAYNFDPYNEIKGKRGKLNGIQINQGNGEKSKLTYVEMTEEMKENARRGEAVNVKAGDLIGYVQDTTKMYPGINNHMHMQMETRDRKIRNPTPYLNNPRMRNK